MEEHWNFHNFIALPLESYSRKYLGTTHITADDIDLGAFVDTMLEILVMVHDDADERKDFIDSCRKYTGLSYHEIPDEISKSLFERFENLLFNRSR